MGNLDVLLMNLPTGTWYKEMLADSNSMPPLGLLYIASYLSKHGYTVEVIDFSIEFHSEKELMEILNEKQPSIVGMSTYNESWRAEVELCKIVKAILPQSKIVAGGAFASFCYEDVLNQSLTDYVLRGEGEYTFLELCDCILKGNQKDIRNIAGVSFKDENQQLFVNNKESRVIDLDNLPFPDRSLVPVEKYTIPYTICTSRGCPGDCIFCSSKAFWGKRVIMRSAQSVFDEVMFLYEKYNTNIFYITDDTFTASKKRCSDFCEMLKKTGISFVWGCESRADVINKEFIKMLYDAGCKKIQFGLESADNDILKKLKKNVTIEQIENAVICAYECGMHIQTSYIVGHAFDTNETIEKTIAFAKHINETYGVRTVCSVNTPFPGTEQFIKREELGIKINNMDWDKFILNNPNISTANLSTNQLRYYFHLGQELVN